jgi:hypothetical protein
VILPREVNLSKDQLKIEKSVQYIILGGKG